MFTTLKEGVIMDMLSIQASNSLDTNSNILMRHSLANGKTDGTNSIRYQ